jgi:hypothetical protein
MNEAKARDEWIDPLLTAEEMHCFASPSPSDPR